MSCDTNDPMPQTQGLISPLSATEIAALVRGIAHASESVDDIADRQMAVKKTLDGLRGWCGDAEITIALMSFAGLQPRPVDAFN